MKQYLNKKLLFILFIRTHYIIIKSRTLRYDVKFRNKFSKLKCIMLKNINFNHSLQHFNPIQLRIQDIALYFSN